jgi:C4-dicarboxylate transporter DctQ subunit
MSVAQQSAFSKTVDNIEETLIAILLGLMTLITFANVIARYVFNSNILWAVEGTVYLFAWLVLMGVAYGIKHSIHIGVDVIVNMFSSPVRKAITLVATVACLVYAVLLLKGSWEYWSPFIGKRAFLETEDIPIPAFLQFLSDSFNDGEKYEKLPRFIPYFVLPLSMALITWRFIQAGWHVMVDKSELLIASHEAEELMEEAGLTVPSESEEGEAK